MITSTPPVFVNNLTLDSVSILSHRRYASCCVHHVNEVAPQWGDPVPGHVYGEGTSARRGKLPADCMVIYTGHAMHTVDAAACCTVCVKCSGERGEACGEG